MRGVPLHKNSSVHIPGCGDLKIKDISYLPDPCPFPDQLKKRALIEKERHIYAPFSGVGGIICDKDAVYIELGGSHSHTVEEDPGLVTTLLETHGTLDEKLQQSELQLFSNTAPIKTQDVDETFGKNFSVQNVVDSGRVRRKVVPVDSELREEDEEDDDEEEEDEEMCDKDEKNEGSFLNSNYNFLKCIF